MSTQVSLLLSKQYKPGLQDRLAPISFPYSVIKLVIFVIGIFIVKVIYVDVRIKPLVQRGSVLFVFLR